MTALEKYMEKLKKELPEICDVTDLVKAGFFTSDQQAYNLRKVKKGPEYIRVNGRYKYLRDSIIEFLEVGSAE